MRSRNPRGHGYESEPGHAAPAQAPTDEEARHLFNMIEHDLPEGTDHLDVLVSTQKGRRTVLLLLAVSGPAPKQAQE